MVISPLSIVVIVLTRLYLTADQGLEVWYQRTQKQSFSANTRFGDCGLSLRISSKTAASCKLEAKPQKYSFCESHICVNDLLVAASPSSCRLISTNSQPSGGLFGFNRRLHAKAKYDAISRVYCWEIRSLAWHWLALSDFQLCFWVRQLRNELISTRPAVLRGLFHSLGDILLPSAAHHWVFPPNGPWHSTVHVSTLACTHILKVALFEVGSTDPAKATVHDGMVCVNSSFASFAQVPAVNWTSS